MKAEEVLNLLQISRKTLHVYAHDGRIRYTVMPNKRYDYSEEDVYKILNKDVKRKTVLHACFIFFIVHCAVCAGSFW